MTRFHIFPMRAIVALLFASVAAAVVLVPLRRGELSDDDIDDLMSSAHSDHDALLGSHDVCVPFCSLIQQDDVSNLLDIGTVKLKDYLNVAMLPFTF